MNNDFKKSKKAILTLLIFAMIFTSFSPVFARRADAFFVDWVNFSVNAVTSFGINSLWVKEYALDAIAYNIVDLIIQRVTASTVNWINGGFRGSPAYVSNPGGYFADLGDKIAGQYIFEDPNLNFLCSPIRLKIRLALTANYIQDDMRWQCTLTEVGRNLDDFMNDFENGGWENFFELTQNRQNNPIGAYLQAEQELNIRMANETILKEKEFDWGRGFMTMKRCKPGSWVEVAPVGVDGGLGANTGGFVDENGVPRDVLPDDPVDDAPPVNGVTRRCAEYENTTPGAVIQEKLGGTLNIGDQKLAYADELNEIISALLNQLTYKLIGSIGSGLRGLSNSGSTNEPAYTNQLTGPAQDAVINRYFEDSGRTIESASNPNVVNYNPFFCRDNPNASECVAPPGAPCDPTLDPSCTTSP